MSSLTRKRQALLPKKNRGSAGRSNGERTGVPVEKLEVGGMAGFRRACDRMLAQHIPGYQVFNFSGQDVTAQLLKQAPEKVKEERVVTRVFWRSKQLRAGS